MAPGRELVALLKPAHRVRVLARSPRPGPEVQWIKGDLGTGLGIAEAVAGARVVLHAATLSPAARRGYFLPADLWRSGVPWSIVRATQFHWLLDRMLGKAARLPALALPTTLTTQPADARDFAAYLLECVAAGPGEQRPDFGGPEVLALGDLVGQWQQVRGRTRPILKVPVPSRVARTAAEMTCPEGRRGTVTWSQWLRTPPAGGSLHRESVAARPGESLAVHVNGQDWLASWHPPLLPPNGTPHGAEGVCVTGDGELVLISQDGERWSFPAGRPEGSETWKDTLRREMREEACATVLRARLLGFSRGACVAGPEKGLVLVRSVWRAEVELGPWEPRFEIRHRRVVAAAQVMQHLTITTHPSAPIIRRTLHEAGIT